MVKTILSAYEAYDADERVNGPEDFEAFQDAITPLLASSAALTISDKHLALPAPLLNALSDWVTHYTLGAKARYSGTREDQATQAEKAAAAFATLIDLLYQIVVERKTCPL